MKATFKQQTELCYKQKTQAIKLLRKPEEKKVSFKNTKRQVLMPFIIYADFEAYTTKIKEAQHGNTTMYQRHVPSDVLLLADVFESFWKMTLATYKLDPAHYFTAPGL